MSVYNLALSLMDCLMELLNSWKTDSIPHVFSRTCRFPTYLCWCRLLLSDRTDEVAPPFNGHVKSRIFDLLGAAAIAGK